MNVNECQCQISLDIFILIEDSKRILPIIPGLSSGAGKMIYAGSIGTQIANELIDTYRCVVLTSDANPKLYTNPKTLKVLCVRISQETAQARASRALECELCGLRQ